MQGDLCWTYANAEGYLASVQTSNLLGTSYQLDKFVKHTRPTWVIGVNSVFNDPTTSAYQKYIVNSAASGSVATDRWCLVTFVWYAGKMVGATYKNGVYQFSNDAVKIVLPYNAQKVHAYSVSTTGYRALGCAKCTRPILGY